MFDYLPVEIISIILQRLPVKTLIKCTTLSKSFFSLITSNEFIYTHLAKNKNSHFLLGYFSEKKEEWCHFECDDDTFSGFQTDELLRPFGKMGDCFNVVGYVNGVYCLVNDINCQGNLILLWNPSIRKYVEVPRPNYVFKFYARYESVCGFGYDSTSNDYKVVRLVHLMDEDVFSKTMEVEVFSLRSGCWRAIGVCLKYRIKRGNGYIPCFLHGYVHWMGSARVNLSDNTSTVTFENVILRFDMSLESFDVIEVPSVVKESGYTFNIDRYVQECNEMLTLINRIYDDPRRCSIWLMKEYGVVKSWTKILDLSAPIMPTNSLSSFMCANVRQFIMPRGFGSRKNGEVIMVRGDGFSKDKNVIVSIDPTTHAETVVREITADCCSFYMSTYVESMVLFKEGKGTDSGIGSIKPLKRKRRTQK